MNVLSFTLLFIFFAFAFVSSSKFVSHDINVVPGAQDVQFHVSTSTYRWFGLFHTVDQKLYVYCAPKTGGTPTSLGSFQSGTFTTPVVNGASDTIYFTAVTNVDRGSEFFLATCTVGGVKGYHDNGAAAPFTAPTDLTFNPDLNSVFFAANDLASGTELWYFTSNSTKGQVADIRSGGGSSSPAELTSLGPYVYFAADNGASGIELFRANLTVAELYYDCTGDGNKGNPTLLTASGSNIWFSCEDPAVGIEPCFTDGSGNTTCIDLFPAGDSKPMEIASCGGVVGSAYITADHPTNGIEAYYCTQVGNCNFLDVQTGGGSSQPTGFTSFGSLCVFAADDGTNGVEPWISDGTQVGTTLLMDIAPGILDSNPIFFAAVSNSVLFSAETAATGREIYMTDGTFTNITQDYWVGAYSSLPVAADPSPTGTATRLFARNANGYSLVLVTATDPATATSTVSVDNTFFPTSNLGSFPDSFLVTPVGLFFVAEDNQKGRHLFFQATESTTPVALTSGILAPSNGGPRFLTWLDSTLYFTFDDESGAGRELWSASTTSASLLSDINAVGSSGVSDLVILNNTLYFAANSGGGFGTEIHTWNGTDAVRISSIYAGNDANCQSLHVSPSSKYLIFVATDGTVGTEVWRWDGSTFAVTNNINPGTDNTKVTTPFVNAGPNVYFGAKDPVTGIELFYIDTSGVANQAADIFTAGDSEPTDLTAFNGYVYFSAFNDTTGFELYRSDGATTNLVQDIFPGITDSKPSNLVVIGSTLYLTAQSDPLAGDYIFKCNTSASGACSVYTTFPTNPTNLANVNDNLFYSASSGLSNTVWSWNSTFGVPAPNNQPSLTSVNSNNFQYWDSACKSLLFSGNLGAGIEINFYEYCTPQDGDVPKDAEPKPEPLDLGALIGGIIGALVVVGAIGFYVVKKRKQ